MAQDFAPVVKSLLIIIGLRRLCVKHLRPGTAQLLTARAAAC